VLGIAKERQRTSPPERADALTDIVLPDHDGNEVCLGDLWREEPVVLAAGGEVIWSHMAEDASDNAPPDEILAAARQASMAG
jgi:hypothetical protein